MGAGVGADLAVGVGVGSGEGVSIGSGVGVGSGESVGVAVGVGDGSSVGTGKAVGSGEGDWAGSGVVVASVVEAVSPGGGVGSSVGASVGDGVAVESPSSSQATNVTTISRESRTRAAEDFKVRTKCMPMIMASDDCGVNELRRRLCLTTGSAHCATTPRGWTGYQDYRRRPGWPIPG